jgi:hypothetical protein
MPDGRPVARLKGDTGSFAFVGELPTGFGNTRLADMRLAFEHGTLALFWAPYRHQLSLPRRVDHPRARPRTRHMGALAL